MTNEPASGPGLYQAGDICVHVVHVACACVSFHMPATVMYKLDSGLHIKQDIVKPCRNKEGRCLDWEGIEEKTLSLLRS